MTNFTAEDKFNNKRDTSMKKARSVFCRDLVALTGGRSLACMKALSVFVPLLVCCLLWAGARRLVAQTLPDSTANRPVITHRATVSWDQGDINIAAYVVEVVSGNHAGMADVITNAGSVIKVTLNLTNDLPWRVYLTYIDNKSNWCDPKIDPVIVNGP